MRYTMTVDSRMYRDIELHLQDMRETESAGFAFGKTSITTNETRLLLREFAPIDASGVLAADRVGMTIDSGVLAKAMKHANDTRQCLIFVHSHPEGYDKFSSADNKEEPLLFRAAYNRIEHPGPHASLVIPQKCEPFARVWLQEGCSVVVDRIRLVGKRFLFFDAHREYTSTRFFDRQVLAFGHNTQAMLKSLHIAIVGAGGTGSAVAEQLIRLGVGKLSIYDAQTLQNSNVSRVYGSRASDEGIAKVKIVERMAKDIELGTEVIAYEASITQECVAKTLRDVDVIFGCSDDQWGRSILCEIATRYMIPVIDMAVKISSKGGHIDSVCGRVTILVPGSACLFCRNRISGERIKAESDFARNPDEFLGLKREGYAPELEETDPSVISFTSGIASLAVTEFLHRLTGFMGDERESTEVIHFFDRSETRTNAVPPLHDCKCARKDIIGTGDSRDFLGMVWA